MFDLAESRSGRHNGITSHPLYTRWRSMWGRCYGKTSKQFDDYGGRGIKVAEIFKDFSCFVEWMGVPKDLAMTIDRIDVNGHYEPGNIQWSSRRDQMLTMRGRDNPRSKSGYWGVTYNRKINKENPWRAAISNLGKVTHIGYYSTKEEAAIAYNKVALKIHGKLAKQNNIEST